MYRHSLSCPTLNDRGRMSQKGRDLLPALEGFGLSSLRGLLFGCLHLRVPSEQPWKARKLSLPKSKQQKFIRLSGRRSCAARRKAMQYSNAPPAEPSACVNPKRMTHRDGPRREIVSPKDSECIRAPRLTQRPHNSERPGIGQRDGDRSPRQIHGLNPTLCHNSGV